MDEHSKRSDFVLGFKGARDSILCYISKTNTASEQHILTSNKSKLHSRHVFLYLSKSIYNCCRWARTTFCSCTEWWLSSVGSREISAKVFPPPPRLTFEFKFFPPPPRSTSEFKFSPNLYKINCTWSMESFYVGSETDISSSDFEWFNFLTITRQLCIKHKKLDLPFKSIKTKLAVIDKARKCWFDCWQYKLRQMRCTTDKSWSLKMLNNWSVKMFSWSAIELLSTWSDAQDNRSPAEERAMVLF